MLLITITLTRTTTISQVGVSLPVTSSDVSDATIPALISTSTVSTGASHTVSKSGSMMSLSSNVLSTIAPNLMTTRQPELDSSAVESSSLTSITSPTASPSSTNDVDNVQEPSTVPAPEKGLSRGQITAIIASVVSVTVLLIAISIAVRCFVVRRRLYNIEELPRRKLGIPADGVESQKGQEYKSETRTSVAESNRSSIWGDIGLSVVPTSLNDDVWDSRHWPLPPGHSERYTFFSERSSTSIDETLEIEQWGRGGKNETRNTRDRNQVATERESGTRSRCDSIWGISEAGIAR
ncbi:uncharacterized protein F4807DRAFT_329979 [Annulohypoxylon truncatum]|uniref:uncharacterized protein n=1 Tax=Annulohypoxylon truncatum TaxID=327061 RepID=UPI00200847E6|nr:uncharacterized protein F4807DRAFT_329979 [Annulohypoxylon truncatum]KAI1204476.1 hypothetical protein F4807DRAFT_329979 [Annulohypoxylon truncatum]